MAIAVGRLLPGLAKTPPWPFRLLGLGYAALGIAVLVIGGLRLQRTTSALQRGSYEPLSSPLVMWLTAAGVALATGTLILVAVAL